MIFIHINSFTPFHFNLYPSNLYPLNPHPQLLLVFLPQYLLFIRGICICIFECVYDIQVNTYKVFLPTHLTPTLSIFTPSCSWSLLHNFFLILGLFNQARKFSRFLDLFVLFRSATLCFRGT